jgi:DNA invertase Pin-like site-specific DNA recombinase
MRLQRTLKTDQAIGKKYHITRQAIHQLRKKYGIESRYAKNPQRNASVVALYRKGKTGTAIAKKMGLSVSQTYRIINTTVRKKGKKR